MSCVLSFEKRTPLMLDNLSFFLSTMISVKLSQQSSIDSPMVLTRAEMVILVKLEQ